MKYSSLKPFPSGFLWGASTSGYQVEGGWDADGKGPSIVDVRDHFPVGTTDFKVAADHYHHLEQDLDLFAELGLKAYRFSIQWTRIFPAGTGATNQAGIAFYHRLIDGLRERGIEPIATMYHFDLPQALAERGGWAARDTIDAFVDYARVLYAEYGAKVRYWLTINEQNMMVMYGDTLGVLDGPQNAGGNVYAKNHNMLLAQARAMALLHQQVPEALIGPAPNISYVYPKTCHPLDVLAADDFNAIRNWLYLDAAVHGRYHPVAWAYLQERGLAPTIAEGDLETLAEARPDFIAFNYYATKTVAAPAGDESDLDSPQGADQEIAKGEVGLFRAEPNPHLARNEFGWEIDPDGFRMTLRAIDERYHLPLLVTENGLGAVDTLTADDRVHDQYRIDYLAAHISAMQEAISDGVQVIGYCPWSAIDLVSTHQGFAKRYGFIYVNRDDDDLKDLARYRKDSFTWYQQLIATGGLPTTRHPASVAPPVAPRTETPSRGHTMTMWPKEELAAITAADDLRIAPLRPDGVTFGTPTWIWSVAVDDHLYVRAYHGVQSRWYGAAVAQRAGRITAAGLTREVTFEPVEGPVNDRIDDAYRAKYAGSPYLAPMLGPRTRAATVRISPHPLAGTPPIRQSS